MLPNREGLFHAYPIDIGLGETRENKLLQVVIQYHLVEELANGEWVDCTAENLEITGYHMLERKDHSLNQITIDALKVAFGWDGRDPFWLQDSAAELAQKPVQVKLGFEEYNGTTRIRVQFLNPYGNQPAGVTKAGDDMRRAVQNRLGAKFRAMAGGTPAPAPKPAGRPTPPAAKVAPPAASSPPRQPSSPSPPPECSADEAWAVFCEAYQKAGLKEGSDEDREKQWFSALTQLFTDYPERQMTGADWAKVRDEAPALILPF